MVTAYFDATYNHPKPDSTTPELHTLAAYIGTNENWKKFRKEWIRELEKKGLPYFHMTDFEFARSQAVAGRAIPRRSQFYEWKEDEFVPFLLRLHNVINRKDRYGRYRLEAAISSILKADFDEALPEELRGDVQCSSYYIFNVLTVIKTIAMWANHHNYNDTIHYVFAGGDGEGGNLERLFADMWDDPVAKPLFRLGKNSSNMPYSIGWMKDEPALQAADVAAFELHKGALEWIARGFVDMPKATLRKSLTTLARTSHYGWVFRKKEIAETFESIIGHNHNRRFRKP